MITDHVTQVDHVTVIDVACGAETALPPKAFTTTITLGIGQTSSPRQSDLAQASGQAPQANGQAAQANGQPAAATSTVYSHSAPLATLQPAVYWDYNLQDLSSLNPADSQQLYFTESGVASEFNQVHSLVSS